MLYFLRSYSTVLKKLYLSSKIPSLNSNLNIFFIIKHTIIDFLSLSHNLTYLQSNLWWQDRIYDNTVLQTKRVRAWRAVFEKHNHIPNLHI